MAQELRQDLRLNQQLVMTPQLQLAIKLLQLSRLELVEAIREELQGNPLLELEDGANTKVTPSSNSEGLSSTEVSHADQGVLAGNGEEKGQGSEELNSSEIEKDAELYDYFNMWKGEEWHIGDGCTPTEDSPWESFIPKKTTLADHLLWQLKLTKLDPEEYEVGVFIIGNIDKDGYLKATVPEIAETFNVKDCLVEGVLKKIQGFDPVGVGARNLKECLLAQVKFLSSYDPLIEEIITYYLPDLQKKDCNSIAKKLGVSLDRIIDAVKVVLSLEPKPGRAYNNDDIHYIVPDIFIYKLDDDFAVVLNDNGMPKLKLSRYYRDMLKNDNRLTKETADYLKNKFKSALWFIKSIHQRQRTLYRVVSTIIDFQREFLENGIKCLRPLILKDVAEAVGMHESTISRVTANKFAYTPQGIFELKFFFNKGFDKGGENIASEVVKDQIRKLITSEDYQKPYTDQVIVRILRRSNVDIARRTVAKYREMMGIPPASKRRKFF